MAGKFSVFVSVLWIVYVLSTHYFFYEKFNSNFFRPDGILKKPYDKSLISDNAYFSKVQVYPVWGEDQTDHARSSNSNQINLALNTSQNRRSSDSNQINRELNNLHNHEENNDRHPRLLAQCTEICTLNNQHVLVCNGQHIPRQLLNLPYTDQEENLPSTDQEENLPYTGQEENLPSSDQEENLPSTDQEENLPSTDREDNLPSTDQEENLPSSDQEENLPSSDQEENLPSTDREENRDGQEAQLPRLSRRVEPFRVPIILPQQSTDIAVVGEFLTIMAYTMTEDTCLRTLLETSPRFVDQTLVRIHRLYHRGNYQDAIREWVGQFSASLANGLDEGHFVLPAFDFSSVVHNHCYNPNCSLPYERFYHVNVVLGRNRSFGNGRVNMLQCFIDQWFHTTERCNAPCQCTDPEESVIRGTRSTTCSTTSCQSIRHRNRRLSSSQPNLVLPINLNRMPFTSSNELPTHVNFGGTRYRLAGVSFRMSEANGRRLASRVICFGQSFYHCEDSFHSQPYRRDPLNGVLSFAYYVKDTGDYIAF